MRKRALWRNRRAFGCWALIGGLLLAAPLMSGCYGGFPMTRSVYQFNREVSDNEIVQALSMWAMVIIPVYEAAWVGDVLVSNVIEFYTHDDVKVGSAAGPDGSRVTLQKTGRALIVRDAQGRTLGRAVRTSDGGLRLTDSQGRTVRALSAAQLAGLQGA